MPPGGLRPGAGRPVGSSSNALKDLRLAIRDICEKKDYKPLEELVDIVQDKDNKFKLTLDQKIGIHKELLQYIAPKLKAVDIQANVQGDIKINVVRFSDNELLDSKVVEVHTGEVKELPQNPIAEVVQEAINQAIEEEDEDE